MSQTDRTLARRLAAESHARGDATGWFDELYRAAAGQTSAVPWANQKPNEHLLHWLEAHPLAEIGRRALVVGCGLGDDAEHLAAIGLAVTAFDVAPAAVAWCRQRFPDSRVDFQQANLLSPPDAWRQAFDFVFEAYTVQSLPLELRETAVRNLARFLAPGGTLLLVARGREASEALGEMPWPIAREDLAPLADQGLELLSFEDYFDGEKPPVRRFRTAYRRPS